MSVKHLDATLVVWACAHVVRKRPWCVYIGACAVNRVNTVIEPRCEKTGLPGFRPGPTQTGI